MQLRDIHIHNFRSIHDQSFTAEQYTLLVGSNNAGKSAVIDCLLAFYEKDGFKFNPKRDLPFLRQSKAIDKDIEAWIDLTFELTKEEYATLPEHYQRTDRILKVRRWFNTAEKDASGRSLKGVIVAYMPNGLLNNEPAFGAANVQKGKFGEVIYIPAVSTVNEHTKVSGPSALRDLLQDVMQSVVEHSPSYKRFSNEFDTFRQSIKTDKGSDGRSLTGLEKQINDRIKSWGAEFKLDFTAPDPAAIIKNNISHIFSDPNHGQGQDATQFGSGFQRQFIYTLIEVAASYATKNTPKKKDFTPRLTLILFEEPEAFLHPTQQESLARKLRLLADSEQRQILCSTHSSHFVTRNCDRISSIVRLRRDSGITRLFQITVDCWKSIVDDNREIFDIANRYPKLKKRLSPDDQALELESLRYFLWLDANRCGVFFANHVLLVEGATELALFPRLISDQHVSIGDSGLFILDTLGKYNTHRFMNLLSAMGIDHSVLVDDDHNKDEHKELNELIRTSKNQDFTIEVEFFEGDLEAVLDIPKPPSDHLKPQHVLVHYDQNRLTQTCLMELASKIEKCLPQSSK